MLDFTLLKPDGILLLDPHGPLTSRDFDLLRTEVNAYLDDHTRLHGVMVRAKVFPGWESWSALTAHLHFVQDHHQRIERLALVTDSAVAGLGEFLARHFTSAEVRHFAYADEALALQWLQTT